MAGVELMFKLIFAFLVLYSGSAAAGNNVCAEVGHGIAYQAVQMHESTVCFVYSRADSHNDISFSIDPYAISAYVTSKSEKPKLLYEFPYAGTKVTISDAFFLEVDSVDEKVLFVISSLHSPKSWDVFGEAYSVVAIRMQGGDLILDKKISRFFDFGGDLIDENGSYTYRYPYKNKEAVKESISSPEFKAMNLSIKINATIKDKTYLYAGDSEPSAQDARRSYLIQGDTVSLEDSMAGWCKILYRGAKTTIRNWVQCESLSFADE